MKRQTVKNALALIGALLFITWLLFYTGIITPNFVAFGQTDLIETGINLNYIITAIIIVVFFAFLVVVKWR